MKRAMTLLLTLTLAPWAVYAGEGEGEGGELTDPLEILKRVDEAAKAVKAVRYDVKFEGLGAAASTTPTVEGSYLLTGWNVKDNEPEKFLISMRAMRGSYLIDDLTVGQDTTARFVIDHKARKVITGTDWKIFANNKRNFMPGVMGEFLHPSPFTDEINAKSRVLKGSAEQGGEDCYEIEVVYDVAGANATATWFISKKDFLPRARHDKFKMRNDKDGAQMKIITKLVVDPPLDDNSFKLVMPEGYEGPVVQ